MSNTVSTLVLRNLHEVFGEIDPVRRRAAIDEIFQKFRFVTETRLNKAVQFFLEIEGHVLLFVQENLEQTRVHRSNVRAASCAFYGSRWQWRE